MNFKVCFKTSFKQIGQLILYQCTEPVRQILIQELNAFCFVLQICIYCVQCYVNKIIQYN